MLTARLRSDGMTFEFIHTPGHTATIIISIYLPELRMLFPGDAAEAPFRWFPMPPGCYSFARPRTATLSIC